MTVIENMTVAVGATLAVILTLAVLALVVGSVVWVGRDARARGLQPVWALQLLMVLDFPFPFLAYWLVTRALDRADEARLGPARS